MTLELDHLAVCSETLEEGVAYVEDTLGVKLARGGRHKTMGTHNKLLALGPGVYLEVIAIDPACRPPRRARWFNLDDFSGRPRLGAWIVRASDFARAQTKALPGTGAPLALSRGNYQWDLLVPEDGTLPFDGVGPTVINWRCATHPADSLPDAGVSFRSLHVTHPRVSDMVANFSCLFSLPGVHYETGATAGLSLEVETPHGLRHLT